MLFRSIIFYFNKSSFNYNLIFNYLFYYNKRRDDKLLYYYCNSFLYGINNYVFNSFIINYGILYSIALRFNSHNNLFIYYFNYFYVLIILNDSLIILSYLKPSIILQYILLIYYFK